MGVGAGLYVYVVVVQKFTFAISSPDEFLLNTTRMWADAQRDSRPPEYRWRRLRKFRNSIPCTTPQSLADASYWSAVQ